MTHLDKIATKLHLFNKTSNVRILLYDCDKEITYKSIGCKNITLTLNEYESDVYISVLYNGIEIIKVFRDLSSSVYNQIMNRFIEVSNGDVG